MCGEEPVPQITVNVAGMAARQPGCLSAAIANRAGAAQSSGTPRAEVPRCLGRQGTEGSNSAQTSDRLPAMLFIDY